MPISRRTLLKGSALAAAAYGTGLALPSAGRVLAGDPAELVAYEGSARLSGDAATKGMMSYRLGKASDGVPPVLRMRRGEEFSARLVNELDEPTTVHWHGFELPVQMDGVPGLTQDPIMPGKDFVYEFELHQAGTFF